VGVVLVRNDVHVASDVRGRLGRTWTRLKGYLGSALGALPVLGVALAAFGAFAVRDVVANLTVEAHHVGVAFYAWVDQEASSFADTASRARQAVKEALLSAGVPFPTQEITVHPPRDLETTGRSLDADGPDGREAALLEAHVRAERAERGERDLLREGRSRAR
jgi:hypothetical protein